MEFGLCKLTGKGQKTKKGAHKSSSRKKTRNELVNVIRTSQISKLLILVCYYFRKAKQHKYNNDCSEQRGSKIYYFS